MALPEVLKYLPLAILPLISATMWLAMLLAMFIDWEVMGHQHLPSMDPNQHIAYISDIGATSLKPLFITGAVITTVFLDLSIASERWLRHTGRLAKNLHTTEKTLSAFAILFAVAGTLGLILLSCFDTLHYPKLHDGFLLLFIAGYILSAIFMCAEYQRLGMHYRQHRILRISFWLKLTFILVEVGLAIVFAATTFTKHQDVAAVFEWIVALIFTFWVLSFLVDLLPATRSRQEVANEMAVRQRTGTSLENGYAGGANVGHSLVNGHADGTVNGNPYAQKPEGGAGNF